MREFWIDTDTASDDAVAILMALRSKDINVLGISVVSGNVPVDKGVKNALYTTELCGKQTPVYKGAAKPLLREPIWAYHFHAEDGMGNMNYPDAKLKLAEGNAIEKFIDAVRANPGKITLVTLGPLTNIAIAVCMAPDIAEKIEMCYTMGGAAATLGNRTPAAEYNIIVDPEAAKIVFDSGIPLMMVGWEHCRGIANLSQEEIEKVLSFNTPFAKFAIECNGHSIARNRDWLNEPGLALPDPVTMAIAIDPSIASKHSKHYVDVEIKSEVTKGMTVVDQLGVLNKEANIEVCWEIDAPKWKDLLYKLLQ